MKNSFRNTIRMPLVLIQIRPDILSGLVWFQTVCKKISADDTRRQWNKAKIMTAVDSKFSPALIFEENIFLEKGYLLEAKNSPKN